MEEASGLQTCLNVGHTCCLFCLCFSQLNTLHCRRASSAQTHLCLQFISRPFVVGDRIEISSVGGSKFVVGTVERVDPMRTIIRTDACMPITIPNKVTIPFASCPPSSMPSPPIPPPSPRPPLCCSLAKHLLRSPGLCNNLVEVQTRHHIDICFIWNPSGCHDFLAVLISLCMRHSPCVNAVIGSLPVTMPVQTLPGILSVTGMIHSEVAQPANQLLLHVVTIISNSPGPTKRKRSLAPHQDAVYVLNPTLHSINPKHQNTCCEMAGHVSIQPLSYVAGINTRTKCLVVVTS